MTTRSNPKTYSWEQEDARGAPFRAGPDGFLEISDEDPPQLIFEVTLRFDGTVLKGYTDVFDVERKSAPIEVRCDDCVT